MSITKDIPYRHFVYYSNMWNGIPLTRFEFQTNQDGYRVCQKVMDWKRKIREGSPASGPFSVNQYKLLRAKPYSFSCVETNVDVAGQITGVYPETANGFPDPTPFQSFSHGPVDFTDVYTASIIKFRKRLQEDRMHMNALVSGGELRETARMLMRPASALRDLVGKYAGQVSKNVRKRPGSSLRGKPSRREVERVVADTYLEWTFGVKPLLSDTEAIAESLARAFEEARPIRRKLSAQASTQNAYDTVSYNASNRCAQSRTSLQRLTTGSVRYLAGLKAELQPPPGSLASVRRATGTDTLDNFVPTVWQLLPWSFLIDYFINISDVLEAGATSTANVSWIQETLRTHTVIHCNTRSDFINPGWSMVSDISTTPGFVSASRVSIVRTPLETVPYPSLTFNNPFGSLGKVANMFALWRQQQTDFVRKHG